MSFVAAFGRTCWALVMPVRWSHDVLYLMLNAPNEQQKKELTRAWQKNKLADLKRIGITVNLNLPFAFYQTQLPLSQLRH